MNDGQIIQLIINELKTVYPEEEWIDMEELRQ